jgi:hypothetical protein
VAAASAASTSVGDASDTRTQDPRAARPEDSPPLTGESDTLELHSNPPKLVPRLDYLRASVKAEFDLVASGLMASFADGEPTPVKGFNGYGVGWQIPTRERGTLTVNPGGTHEFPSVRVSGWPSEAVAGYLRGRWEGQASRVDAAVDFAGELVDWCRALQDYAEVARMKWGTYHVGTRPTGLELGAGKSESRTRCYDATLAHPGEFAGPTTRLEHEWKPEQKARKELAYHLDAGTVLGTSRAARLALERLAGLVLPAAPSRTERVSDLDRWAQWFRDVHSARLIELLERNGGNASTTIFELLGYEETLT